jgi:hypothetical protein
MPKGVRRVRKAVAASTPYVPSSSSLSFVHVSFDGDNQGRPARTCRPSQRALEADTAVSSPVSSPVFEPEVAELAEPPSQPSPVVITTEDDDGSTTEDDPIEDGEEGVVEVTASQAIAKACLDTLWLTSSSVDEFTIPQPPPASSSQPLSSQPLSSQPSEPQASVPQASVPQASISFEDTSFTLSWRAYMDAPRKAIDSASRSENRTQYRTAKCEFSGYVDEVIKEARNLIVYKRANWTIYYENQRKDGMLTGPIKRDNRRWNIEVVDTLKSFIRRHAGKKYCVRFDVYFDPVPVIDGAPAGGPGRRTAT